MEGKSFDGSQTMYIQNHHALIENHTPALWRQAFRPFFLGGSLFSILALFAWGAVLTGAVNNFTPYGGVLFWHAHEMIFGFGAAIVCGFLLTAVQSWTGIRATHGYPLAGLFSLWLAARLLLAVNLDGWQWLIAVVDVSFFPVLSILVGQFLYKAGSYRNMILLPVLNLLAFANLATHLSVLMDQPHFFRWGAYSAVALVVLLITIIGGRVIPMFTANGTQTPMVAPIRWLESSVIASTLVIVLLFSTQLVQVLPRFLTVLIFVFAALVHGYRVYRWRFNVTLRVPLVWSLHLAYWFIPCGLGLYALHYAGTPLSLSTALHGLTAGAMGTIILAMITRVSLGHTGRSFETGQLVALSFALIFAAGLARVLGGLFPQLGIHAYGLAILFWIVGYSIFLGNNCKALFTPRPDGGIS